MDRRVDVRHFVHRRSCDISSSNMAAYERWPRVSGRGTKYSSEVCRMGCGGGWGVGGSVRNRVTHLGGSFYLKFSGGLSRKHEFQGPLHTWGV